MKSVSIILPVYKVEKYIGDCIKSIIDQKFTDFELIIVDDATPDRSIKIAEELLRNSSVDYRIVHRPNGGLSAARNTGIREAKGAYLAFVDSDDVITPDYLETLYGDAHGNQVDLAIACFRLVTEQTKFDFDLRQLRGTVVDKKVFLQKILKRKIFNYFGCFLISRQYIIDNKLFFDESVFFGVDQAYMWRLMVNVERYTFTSKEVYNYFERPGSIMTATKIDKMLTGLPSLEKCARDLANNFYFDSEFIVERWKISALHTIAKSFTFSEFRNAVSLFKPSIRKCLRYPDARVKAIAIALIFGKKAAYEALRKF